MPTTISHWADERADMVINHFLIFWRENRQDEARRAIARFLDIAREDGHTTGIREAMHVLSDNGIDDRDRLIEELFRVERDFHQPSIRPGD